jgi:hypothetical protein
VWEQRLDLAERLAVDIAAVALVAHWILVEFAGTGRVADVLAGTAAMGWLARRR